MIKHNIFFIGCCALLLFSCNAQENKISDNTDIASFINQKGDSLQKNRKLPGLFVAVSDSGKRSFYNFGFAAPDKKYGFDSLTIFEAGSITKTFTALVLKTVLREHKINDSLPVKNYLPGNLDENETLSAASFLSLMNHTSGLARIPDNMPVGVDNKQPYENYRRDNLFSYLKNARLKPDGKSNYSNTGFALCGILAESISGKKYEALLKQLLFDPLNMNAFLNVPDSLTNISQGYYENIKNPFWNFDCMAPAGAIKCSAHDLLNYLEFMYSNTNDPTIHSLLQPTVTVNENIKVCRAWHTMERNNNTMFYWHNGGTYGFSTFVAFSKEKRKAVVVVINKFNTNDAGDRLGIMIMRRLLN
ncbi:MAG: beta-lactamase family protein [Sphingobacteriales bacterium]|nr:beta-lactamase family protein [Sphingobacteriales bacterium]